MTAPRGARGPLPRRVLLSRTTAPLAALVTAIVVLTLGLVDRAEETIQCVSVDISAERCEGDE